MIRYSKYLYGPKDVTVPASINFGEFMLEKFWNNRDKVALINGATHEIVKYGQLAQEATNLAVSLTRLGVKKGEVIAIMSENRREYFSIFVAIATAGAVATTINPLYTEGEINHILSISKPTYLFCTSTSYELQENNLKSYQKFKKIIVIDDGKIDNSLHYRDLATYNETRSTDNGSSLENNVMLRKNVTFEEITGVDVIGKSDTLVILYSSGTTGMPKGVLLTHHNMITMCNCEPLDFGDGIIMMIGPWFHAMGLVGTLTGFTLGKSFAFLPKFDVESMIEIVDRYKVEMLIVVPAVVVAIVKSPAQFDFSSVKRVLAGAAPLHRDTAQEFLQKFPNVSGIIQGYGMTECSLAVAKNRFGDSKTNSTSCVGKVMEQTVIKILDPSTRNPLGPHQNGEICIKSDLLMKGYVGKDPREYLDHEGFFLTGDVGYYDEEGYLFIVDRLKELIKYKANQVAPAELEAVLLLHEAVREAGVVGLLDKDAGELPLAFVSLQPGKSATEKEIQDFVAVRVSNPKRLRGGVRFLDEIPKNATGKIQRQVLRRLANNAKGKL